MNISTLSAWAPHLRDPLVLVGFVVMLLVIIIAVLLRSKVLLFLTESSERLIGRVITYLFIIAAMVVVLSFWKAAPRGKASAPTITQTTKGEQSPAVVTQGKDAAVDIQYGDTKDAEEAKRTNNPAQKGKKGVPQPSQGSIKQQTEGAQSPAVVSDGDVNITYEGKKK